MRADILRTLKDDKKNFTLISYEGKFIVNYY